RSSLEATAEAMGVDPDYLARVNRLEGRSIGPGSTLVAFPRWLVLEVGRAGSGAGVDRVVERYGARVSGIIDARTPPGPGHGGEAGVRTPEEGAPPAPPGAPSTPLPWPEGATGWIHVSADMTRLQPGWGPAGRESRRGDGVRSLVRW